MSIVAANGLRICGRFTLLGKLGEGGEGEVWRARDHEQGKEIALKILRPEIAQRADAREALEREHEIASGLDHPLILKVGAPVQDGETIALPMELASEGDLRRLCGVSYLEIVPVLLEVAHALAYAHERGVVHRDLKASNVLFDARGHVRVADFGTARAGLSPFTASPQQLRGEPPSVADDIYG
ncbi:MAG: protein kinase domain-containing protein, partial [Steroidobacteraceae bacterium]